MDCAIQKDAETVPKMSQGNRFSQIRTGDFYFGKPPDVAGFPFRAHRTTSVLFWQMMGVHIPAVNRWCSSYGAFQWWIHDNETSHSLPLYQLLNSRRVCFLICLAFRGCSYISTISSAKELVGWLWQCCPTTKFFESGKPCFSKLVFHGFSKYFRNVHNFIYDICLCVKALVAYLIN